jgi:RNA polymerase sigma factor (sigma-70 family)
LILLNRGREEDARDVFQDVLLAVLIKAQAGNLTLSSSFGAYLYSVSRLLWLRELKRRRRLTSLHEEAEEIVSAAGDIFEDISARERQGVYRKHFEELSEDCRKILLLFQEGNSIAEITRLMGFRSEQHTRNRQYRCKKCLIRKIREFYRLST